MPRRRLLPIAALAIALLEGCGGGGAEQPPKAASEPGVDTPAGSPDPSRGKAPAAAPALEFTGATVGGGRFDAATLRGRPALVWFWAPW